MHPAVEGRGDRVERESRVGSTQVNVQFDPRSTVWNR